MKFLTTWRFDSLSFWIGFLFAALLAFVFYRLRVRIAAFREAMGESYRTAVEALTTTAAQGYRNDLMRWAQSAHIVTHLFALEEILLPPRVLAAPPPAGSGPAAGIRRAGPFPLRARLAAAGGILRRKRHPRPAAATAQAAPVAGRATGKRPDQPCSPP